MKVVVSFTDENMTKSAERLEESAYKFGADKVEIYTPDDFDRVFYAMVEAVLPNSRGVGWWIWKPWIIFNQMTFLADGDILIYSDAGQEIVADLNPLINAMDEDIMLFSNGWQHSHWCKRETAIAIDPYLENNGSKAYYEHKQVQASFILFKVNQNTRRFVQEWLAWCIQPDLIDNTPRGQQFLEFQESRHDQAILTCLQIKYKYKLHWFPSTTNQHQRTNESYDTTILHHRMRNNDY